MGVKDMISKTPNWVLFVCGTIVAVFIISSVTLLSFSGKSSDDLFRLLNLAMNGLTILLSGGAFAAASAAAHSSSNVEDKQDVVASDLAETQRNEAK